MKNKHDIHCWLGTEASHLAVLAAQEDIRTKTLAGFDGSGLDENPILSVSDGVAVISIFGPLSNSDSMMNQMFGITSYNDIRSALVLAVNDPEVDSIILDVDTPGGDASGVSDIAEFISSVSANYKPVDVYVSGSAFSAGYWIASAADAIYGPKMAESGSIGVIAVIKNKVKMMEKDGIEAIVFRGGKYKALGNPYEKLTKDAKKIIQTKIDKMEGFFLDAVAANRNIPRASVKAQVGEGLTFFAEESVQNGLMDEVVPFDVLFSRHIKRKKNKATRIMNEDTDMGKKVLTDMSVAAIAAGATPESVDDLNKGVSEDEVLAASDKVETVEENVEVVASDDVAAKDEVSAPESVEVTDEVSAKEETSLVAYLKEENAKLTLANADLSAKFEKSESSSTLALANEVALKGIVEEYIAGMSVGLGMASMSLEGMNSDTVLKQYSSVRTEFTNRFKVGNVAEVEDDEPESSGKGLTAMELASIKSNKI